MTQTPFMRTYVYIIYYFYRIYQLHNYLIKIHETLLKMNEI